MTGEQKLRVLAILPDAPAAASTGGAVRAWHFLRALLQNTDARVYVLAGRDERRPDVMLSSDRIHWCGRLAEERVREKTGAAQRVVRTLLMPMAEHGRRMMLAGENLCVQRSRAPGFRIWHRGYALILMVLFAVTRRLFRLDPGDIHVRGAALDVAFQHIFTQLSAWRPDIIWLEHSYLYSVGERLREHFPDAKIVVNAHNVEQQLKTMIGRSQTTLPGRWWGLQEAALMGAIERRMVRDAALVYCCSEADRVRFQNLHSQTECQLMVVPNGVDTEYFHSHEAERNSETLIFTGTAGYKPNDDAVQWLVEGILPGILKVRPGVRLILAGMNAGSRWGQYRKEGLIEVHCSVPDMRPLLGRAAVSVVPLRSGSGTRLKILEALSSGCAVVSTSIGAEGLAVTEGREILIADTERDFAAAVSRILGDEFLQARLREGGRQLVERSYDWKALERQTVQILHGVCRQGGAQFDQQVPT